MNEIYTTLTADQVEEIATAHLAATGENTTIEEDKEMLRQLEPEISNPPEN